MPKLVKLVREEEYFRRGVWKIYYRLAGVNYIDTGTRTDGSTYIFGPYDDEIKFSGKDAEERSLAVYEEMKKDLES